MYDEQEMPMDPEAEAAMPETPGPVADLAPITAEEEGMAEEVASSYDEAGRLEALRQMLNEKAQERRDRSMQFQQMSRGVL